MDPIHFTASRSIEAPATDAIDEFYEAHAIDPTRFIRMTLEKIGAAISMRRAGKGKPAPFAVTHPAE